MSGGTNHPELREFVGVRGCRIPPQHWNVTNFSEDNRDLDLSSHQKAAMLVELLCKNSTNKSNNVSPGCMVE